MERNSELKSVTSGCVFQTSSGHKINLSNKETNVQACSLNFVQGVYSDRFWFPAKHLSYTRNKPLAMVYFCFSRYQKTSLCENLEHSLFIMPILLNILVYVENKTNIKNKSLLK